MNRPVLLVIDTLDEFFEHWDCHLQPDALVLAGINTHACIRTTAIDAYQRDWRVVLASDCIASYDQEHHEVSLRYMHDKIAAVLTNEQIASVCSGAGL